MTDSKETRAMKLALEGAANYIDALGGDSRKYRQALAEQPEQRKPLTDERIFELIEKHTEWYPAPGVWRLSEVEFARAIEAAHGIKEKNT